MSNKTTEQDFVTPPQLRNPSGKGGFGDNPQNRNPGGWDKTQSISYQYHRLMRLNPEELAAFKPETVAQEIALKRITIARTEAGLNDTKEITDRTEGKAIQSVDVTSNGETLFTNSKMTIEVMSDKPKAESETTQSPPAS